MAVAGDISITGNISVTGTTTAQANANTLVGSTLSSNVLVSSLTSVGTLSSLAVSGNASANNVSVTNDLSIGGNLSVTGNIITVNTSTLLVEDNVIKLNSGTSASPTENASLTIERGTSSDVSIRWNETSDTWQLTNDGSTYADIQSNITAGSGLAKAGNTINIVTASSDRVVVNAANIDLASVTQTNTSGSNGISFVQSHAVDSYGRITGTVTANVRDASTTVKGIASFNTADFSVTDGEVTIKSNGVDNAQLVNSSFTINGTTISLGDISTVTANANTLTGSTLPLGVIGSSLTSVGTLTIGVWNATAIAIQYGGTGASSAMQAINNLLPDQTGNIGKTLRSNGSAAYWSVLSLDDLNDVTANSNTSGDFLRFSSGQWINTTASLDDLSDVAISAPTLNQVVRYNGSTWVNQTVDIAPSADPSFTGTVTANAISANTLVLGLTANVGSNLNVTGHANVTGNLTVSNSVVISGNLTVSGTTTTVNTATLNVADNIITLNSDFVFASGAPIENAGVEVLRGNASTVAVRWNETSDLWELTEDGTNYDVISKSVQFNQQIASYTLVRADRSKLIEINNASAVTLTVPADNSVNFPVGTEVRVLQTGAGQITLTPASGVTINATPGLKLRAQWSSANLVKRAANTWVALGDLSA